MRAAVLKWMVVLLAVSLGAATSSLAASAEVAPPVEPQGEVRYTDWCFDWDVASAIENNSWIGPVPNSPYGGHGSISIPIGTYTLLGCDGYTFWLTVTWDYNGTSVANVAYWAYYADINWLMDIHPHLSESAQPLYGGYQYAVAVQGHVNNHFGIDFGISFGFDIETYPYISVTVVADGSYWLNYAYIG